MSTPSGVGGFAVMKALSQAVPGRVSAGIGNLKVIAFSGLKGETHWVHMEIFEGSYGGREGMDGMDAVDTLFANTRNNPIEDIESHLPLRVSRYELRRESGGAGKWRGGLGAVREFEFLADGGFAIEGEGHVFRPWGFRGGEPGLPASLMAHRNGAAPAALPSKVPYGSARAGDHFVMTGPIGGGYGNPLERDPERVRQDVLDGFVSPAEARTAYRVALTEAGEVDTAATAALRAG